MSRTHHAAHTTTERRITGKTVLIIAVSAFAVILTANMALLFSATGSFPGLVVKNSYVASQGFDARTQAQAGLGWDAAVDHAGGALAIRVTGADGGAIDGLAVTATVGRPATDIADRSLTLASQGEIYTAPLALEPGRWQVRLEARDTQGRAYRAHATIFVPEAS